MKGYCWVRAYIILRPFRPLPTTNGDSLLDVNNLEFGQPLAVCTTHGNKRQDVVDISSSKFPGIYALDIGYICV
jgi:hypothetical protein